MTTGVKCETRVWVRKADETVTPGVAINGVAGKDAALTGSNVEYDGALGAIILRPQHRVNGLPVMSIADWQATGWQVKDGCLHWPQNGVSTAVANYQHPVAPWITCVVKRNGQPAEWQLQWGNGKMLTFGTGKPPFLSVNGVITAALPLNPAEYYHYINDAEICWEVRDFMGDIVITCSAFTRVWYIPGVGGATTGNLSISADASTYSVVLFAMKFATTGYFDTSGTITDVDYCGVVPADVNAQIADAGGGLHRVSLSGDGDHTPAVKGWRIFRRTHVAEQLNDWQQITDSLLGGHMEYSYDCGKANMLFNGFPDANRIMISQQIELADGRILSVERGEMLVTGKQARMTNTGTTLRVAAICRLERLKFKRVNNLPSLHDIPADEAIALIAECAGVNNMKIWQQASNNSIEGGQWWGNRGGDPPLNEKLSAANDWRGEMPWSMKGNNAWDLMKMLAGMYQLRVWFEDDELQIRRAALALPVNAATYSVGYGADPFLAPAGIAIADPGADVAVAANYVANGGVVTQTGDIGADIVVNCPANITTSDSAMKYTGYAGKLLKDKSFTTITGRTALWNRKPGDAVCLNGTGNIIDGMLCRVVYINIALADIYRTVVKVDADDNSGWVESCDAEKAEMLSMPILSPVELNGIICAGTATVNRYFTIGVSAIASADKIR